MHLLLVLFLLVRPALTRAVAATKPLPDKPAAKHKAVSNSFALPGSTKKETVKTDGGVTTVTTESTGVKLVEQKFFKKIELTPQELRKAESTAKNASKKVEDVKRAMLENKMNTLQVESRKLNHAEQTKKKSTTHVLPAKPAPAGVLTDAEKAEIAKLHFEIAELALSLIREHILAALTVRLATFHVEDLKKKVEEAIAEDNRVLEDLRNRSASSKKLNAVARAAALLDKVNKDE